MYINQYFDSLLTFNTHIKTQNNDSLFVITFNVRSISSFAKFNQLKSILSQFSKIPDVICIQETWFDKNLLQLYNIPGYDCVHSTRYDCFGGTSIYIREDLNFSVEVCDSKDFIETIRICIKNIKVNGKPLKILSFYRSPKNNFQVFLNFIEESLNDLSQSPYLIMGDSNVDFLQGSSSHILMDLLNCYDCRNCHNLVSRPISGTSIDNIFSNIEHILQIDSIECCISDHNIIGCRIKQPVITRQFYETERSSCNYELVSEKLSNDSEIFNLTGNPNDDTFKVIGSITNAVSCSTVTYKTIKDVKDDIAPWMNKNIHKLLLYKKKLLKLRKKMPNNVDIKYNLKRISKVIKIACKQSMKDYYYENLCKIKQEPKKCWQFLNKTLGRNTKTLYNIGNDITDEDKAEIFNHYFINSVETLKRKIESTAVDNFNSLRTVKYIRNEIQIQHTNYSEIENLVLHLEMNKSPGKDTITAKCIFECKDVIIPFLLKIFNAIIDYSIYPDALKVHKIIPIPKEKISNTVDKFRPIAVLSTIDKIFEKILYKQLSTFIENESLMFPNQYGFRKGCGTDEAALNVVNFICNSLDNGFTAVGGVFYDFTKAFDLIDHSILLNKLQFYGFRGRNLELIRSYLTNRKQFVQINASKSSLQNIKYGVPQGSVLGPLLFAIYLNDINNLELNGRMFMYADDICVLYPYKENLVLKTYVERDAALISEFARINKLMLNPTKTKFIRFMPRPNLSSNISICMDGNEILEVDTITYLGLKMQSNLSWHHHIEQIRSKISPALGVLYKLRYNLDTTTKLIIFQSLIQSHLNYLTHIYGFRKNADLKSLQVIQSKALKLIYNLPLLYPTLSLYTDVVKNILPIYGLYKMKTLIYVYNALHGIGHHTICFSRNQTVFNTRNSHNLRAVRCRLEITKQKIEYAGSLEYNNLPQHIKDCCTISSFKNKLKEYLLQNIEMLLI